MALPLTGTITSAMILAELGFTSPSDVLYNIVQRPGGVLQVLVNSTWVNLNLCSPYLPTEVGPYIVPTHWYGYNHKTTGVETITITGDSTVDEGQTVTYTATLTGDNLAGVVLTWSKFAAGAWVDNIATGNSVTITWLDPRNAKVRVTASNVCNKNVTQKELDISYNCVLITGDPYIVGSLDVNRVYDIYIVNSNGVVGQPGNTRLGITFFWEVFGPIQLVSGQGTNTIAVRPLSASTNSVIRVTIGSCGGSHTSINVNFDTSNPVTVYYNTQQSRSIQKICESGQVGSFVTVIRAAGTHSSNESVEHANSLAVSWLFSQDAQNIAQSQGTCGNTATYPNERQSQRFDKNNCSSGLFGTSVEYVVEAGRYNASTVSAANTIALNDIAANGQNYANSNGQCLSGICEYVVADGMGLTYGAGVGYIDTNLGVTVSTAGTYELKRTFAGFTKIETIQLDAGQTFIGLSRFFVTGTSVYTVTVSSICSTKSTSTPSFTVSGVTCVTASSMSVVPVRNSFLNGTAQFAVNMSPIDIKGVSGYFTFLGVNYPISGVDFSSGFTQYLSFSANPGVNGTGIVTLTFNNSGNMCNSSINGSTSTQVQIVSPVF
jgi:hypothetical protein